MATDGATNYMTGDFDGSNNWEYICWEDSEGVKEAARNYPAFNWVNAYADTYGLSGDSATGWYMPSAVELRILFENRPTVNAALSKATGSTSSNFDSGLKFWTSSQHNESATEAWYFSYNNDSIESSGETRTNTTSYFTCAVREF